MPEVKKAAKFKLPVTLGACADRLYTIDLNKAKNNKANDLMDEERIAIEAHLSVKLLPKSKLDGATGKVGKVRVWKEDVPVAQDWTALEKHIKKTGEFDLLQRRLSSSAVKERLKLKKKVPGVGTFKRTVVSVTKA